MSVAVSGLFTRPRTAGRYVRHECAPGCRERMFWSQVDPSAGQDGCWLFQGSTSDSGYGRFCHAGQWRAAHRESLILAGRLEPGSAQLALHKVGCPNRNCVNPAHLYAGTYTDNNRDTVKAGNHKGAPPHGDISDARRMTDGEGEDWLSLRYRSPGFGLSQCVRCDGLGQECSVEKTTALCGDFNEEIREFYVSTCKSCGATGLTPGSEVERVFARIDADDVEPLDRLRESTGPEWGSLFEKRA